jgi:hypothetical protein
MSFGDAMFVDDESTTQNLYYYVFDEDSLKQTSVEANYELNDAVIIAFVMCDNYKALINKWQYWFKQCIDKKDAYLEEDNDRTFCILVKKECLDIFQLVLKGERVRYHVFESVKDYLNFDSILVDII